jgi:hypothetical protein
MAAGSLALVAACKPLTALEQATTPRDLRRELVRLDPGPPPAEPGMCWEGDIIPAVIETVSEQQVVSPEVRAEDGSLLEPASYRTVTRQRIAQEREVVWFRAPCDAELTVEFVGSLQRALKARGYYTGPTTGLMDPATQESVRRYQADRGLDSARLSLGAARQLGLAIVPVDEL